MPTYEYRCGACGHRFERFQKISEPPVKSCPECRKRRVERLISKGGGLVFKGPGFYATDYRKDGPSKSREKGADGGDAVGGGESDGGSDAEGGGDTGDAGDAAGARSSGDVPPAKGQKGGKAADRGGDS